MAKQKSKPKKENNKKKGRIALQFILRRIAAVLVFLLVIAAIVATFTLFFHLKTIDVKGTLEIYSKQDIMDAAELKYNQSMFTFSARSIEKRIEGKLPYVSKVSVKRTLPSKVTITVLEADNALVVPNNLYGYLVLSRDLHIIRRTEGYTGKALEIYGISPKETAPGKELMDEDELHIEHLEMLLDLMEKYHVLSGATAVNVSDKLNLEVIYGERIYAVLGTSSYLERKVRMLEEMVTNQLEPDEYGRLDLSVSGKATFASLSEEDFKEIKKKVCTIQ
ncbi:MAG: FtsQ-type POTRA domain-containing protein [Oscillospiraceae bacterium]|nr:FtsQ-type POTRA domain-containing protein [Oscillospiraceae bacterium]MBR0451843.1 FtsQ-type POTRA domain-containing protein [Oscillospiraceae bacterium]